MASTELFLLWIAAVSAVSVQDTALDKGHNSAPLNCIHMSHSHMRRFTERAYRQSLVVDFRVGNVETLPTVKSTTSELLRQKKKRSLRMPSAVYKHDTKPWLCSPVFNWVDLGPDYYPRFIKTAECPQTSCWYGVYSCKSQPYTIKVMHRKSGNVKNVFGQSDVLCNSAEISSSPNSLTVWEFKDIAISIRCDCT